MIDSPSPLLVLHTENRSGEIEQPLSLCTTFDTFFRGAALSRLQNI